MPPTPNPVPHGSFQPPSLICFQPLTPTKRNLAPTICHPLIVQFQLHMCSGFKIVHLVWGCFSIFVFWPYHMTCEILVPQPGIELWPSAVRTQSSNHWTTREFPGYFPTVSFNSSPEQFSLNHLFYFQHLFFFL